MSAAGSFTRPPGAPKAYRYARFSHSRQADGMSLERQADVADRWARERGMELDDSYAFVDEGVSASKGKNLMRGALAELLKAVKGGDVARGSYLVVESTSRLTRLVPRLASKIVETFVAQGVCVVFLDTRMEYNAETIDQLGHDITFRVSAAGNAEYSQNLKRYVTESWRRKKGLARSELIPATRMVPYWLKSDLTMDAQGRRGRTAIEPHPVYAPVIERIFREYLAGRGKEQIAAGLNADKVPPPVRVGSKEGKRATFWRHGLIGRTLASPAVCGIFQPHRELDSPKAWSLDDLVAVLKRTREADGEPIPGYYPRVISDEIFAQAAVVRDQNRAKAGRKTVGIQGRKAGEVTHILARLACCPVCGSAMMRANKGKGLAPRYVCSRALAGKSGACQRVYVPVADVEKALVAAADTLSNAPGGDPAIAAEIQALEARHATVTAQAAQLTATVEELIDRVEPVPSVMSAKLAKLETERDTLAGELQALRGKATATQPNVIRLRVANMVGALKAYGEGPLSLSAPAVNAALYECFVRAVIDYRSGEVVMHWRHGPPPATVRYR